MSTHVIYHYADYDGLLSAAVCLHFMPDAVIHGWDYGNPTPEIPDDCDKLYIVDLSVPELMDDPRLIWIDHHKSAIDKWDRSDSESDYNGQHRLKGLRIDGVAACRLCWRWFQSGVHGNYDGLSDYVRFKNRDPLLKEPLILTLAGEYDIWFEDGNPEWDDCVALQHGLRLFSNDPAQLSELFKDNPKKNGACADDFVRWLIERGRDIELYQSEQNASILKYNSYVRDWEGLTFLVLNLARGNSRSFPVDQSLAWPVPYTGSDTSRMFVRNAAQQARGETMNGTVAAWDDIDALCMWKYCGDGQVTASLYHKTGRKDLDLSLIAVKHGGGGHRGACGFKMPMDEFAKVLL